MKWKNKGHEFDDLARVYLEKFGDKSIFVFGAGTIGARHAGTFFHFGLLKGFVDNNLEKQGEMYFERPVISLEEWVKTYRDNSFLVVCVDENNFKEICPQLLGYGLKKGKEFIWHETFNDVFCVIMAYKYNKVFLPLVQISLTERCTLRCRKCAHACNLVPHDVPDLLFEETCHSADILYTFVDYVREFVLIGGEPLLYKDLARVIEYIGSKYRDRIDFFSITTNGTITPSDEILRLCKKFDVIIRISNYSKSIPQLESRYEQLIAKLEHNHISYSIAPKDLDWMDYGFEYVDRKGNAEQLMAVFDACRTPCHEIRDSRFYFCVMARSVAENMKRQIGSDDYLDLATLCSDTDKRLVFEYIMGYSEKGYLDMCNHCHGAETEKYPIPSAEQMK